MPKSARDSKGRFLPRKKSTTNPRRRRRKTNSVAYPKATNPRRRRRRRSNPSSYAAAPAVYRSAPNPRRRRRRNPNGNMSALKNIVKPALTAMGGFLAPGLVWEIIGEKGRTSVVGWFSKSKNPDGWGRFTIGALTTLILYFISNKVKFLKDNQIYLMTGLVMRNLHDLADAVLDKTPGSMGARLRRVMALPTAAQMSAPGTAGQQAGYIDPTTGQWVDQSQQAGLPTGGMDELDTIEAQMTGNMNGQQSQQLPGMMGVHALDSGVGELYVDRQLRAVPSGIGELYVNRQLVPDKDGYQGVGAYYVDEHAVYLERGQRFPATLSKLY